MPRSMSNWLICFLEELSRHSLKTDARSGHDHRFPMLLVDGLPQFFQVMTSRNSPRGVL